MKKKTDKIGEHDAYSLPENSGIKRRATDRRRQIVANRALGFKEAEKWDLEFWQSQTPEQRLSALMAIRRDVIKVKEGRSKRRNVKKSKP
jgi:hypothetical protein